MRAAFGFLLAILMACGLVNAQEFKITKEEDGVTINVDGKLFARYVIKGHKKPVIWPIVGPTGKEMTRAYPFKEVEDEKKDHPHHESFWFDHGNVNGTDFWMIGDKSGVIEHREFSKLEEGKTALLVTKNDWRTADGKKVCEDHRSIRFGADAASRWIDFEVEVMATEGDLKFGDTKEGSFGVRVPSSMDVDAKKGGLIENSEGQTDAEAWGKPAKWVDYSGPVGGDERLGIAILNHPRSFRFPTTWHVRTYGLFAANPFGAKEFHADPAAYGDHTIAAGGKMRLAYRVLLHQGDAKSGQVEKAFTAYAEAKLELP